MLAAGGHGTLQSAPLHVEEGGRLDAVEHLHGQGVEGAVAEVAVLLLRPQAAHKEQHDKKKRHAGTHPLKDSPATSERNSPETRYRRG